MTTSPEEKVSDVMGIMVKSSRALEKTLEHPPGSEGWHNAREMSIAVSLIGIGTSLASIVENLDRLVGNKIADVYTGSKEPRKVGKRGSKASD